MDSNIVIDIETWLRLPKFIRDTIEKEIRRTESSKKETEEYTRKVK